MNNNIKAPCRYDFVGSFLRPDYLKKARADFENGAITAEQLKEVEDKAILDLVAKQKKAGYHIITDGEFRRATWHLDFMWGFNGVGHSKTQTGLPFHGEAAMIDDTYLTGKVSVGDHPFVEHFKFVKNLEDENTVGKHYIYQLVLGMDPSNPIEKVTEVAASSKLNGANLFAVNELTAKVMYFVNNNQLYMYDLVQNTEELLRPTDMTTGEEIT